LLSNIAVRVDVFGILLYSTPYTYTWKYTSSVLPHMEDEGGCLRARAMPRASFIIPGTANYSRRVLSFCLTIA
jgi:hypothetical protein